MILLVIEAFAFVQYCRFTKRWWGSYILGFMSLVLAFCDFLYKLEINHEGIILFLVGVFHPLWSPQCLIQMMMRQSIEIATQKEM